MGAGTSRPLLILSACLVGVWLILAALPFVWTLWGSFKVEADFFSRADWRNALWGTRTVVETGAPLTTDGYSGAWIEEEFWRAAGNTMIVVLFT
ncbi:MAG: carbohydrate ABC transporter permease, partial [Pseudomonadota bacterium]